MGSSDSLNPNTPYSLILFDGVCNLCNGAVRFIIKRDHKNRFRFASLQSPTGQLYIKHYSIRDGDLYSIVLIEKGKSYDRSAAMLEIVKHLSGLWPVFYIFKIVPFFIRDAFYRFVAKNRYRLFGRMDECMIPTAELRARFLD
jgi:predicted DCC family thiol-disulfide oxidoreductase YuxK